MKHAHTHISENERTLPNGRDYFTGAPYCPLCAGKPEFPLTQDRLREFACDDCGKPTHETNHMYMQQKCHPRAGVLAEYCHVHGTLTVVCSACKRRLDTLLIACDNGDPQ